MTVPKTQQLWSIFEPRREETGGTPFHFPHTQPWKQWKKRIKVDLLRRWRLFYFISCCHTKNCQTVLQKKRREILRGVAAHSLHFPTQYPVHFFFQYGKSLSLRRLKYTARSSGGIPPQRIFIASDPLRKFFRVDFYVSPGSNRLQHYFWGKHFDSVLVFPPSFIFRAASQGLRRGTLKAYGRDSSPQKKLPSLPSLHFAQKSVSHSHMEVGKIVNSAFLFLKWRPAKVVRRGSVGMSKGHLGG